MMKYSLIASHSFHPKKSLSKELNHLLLYIICMVNKNVFAILIHSNPNPPETLWFKFKSLSTNCSVWRRKKIIGIIHHNTQSFKILNFLSKVFHQLTFAGYKVNLKFISVVRGNYFQGITGDLKSLASLLALLAEESSNFSFSNVWNYHYNEIEVNLYTVDMFSSLILLTKFAYLMHFKLSITTWNH